MVPSIAPAIVLEQQRKKSTSEVRSNNVSWPIIPVYSFCVLRGFILAADYCSGTPSHGLPCGRTGFGRVTVHPRGRPDE